jgi:beta-glucanase (GH16 family)
VKVPQNKFRYFSTVLTAGALVTVILFSFFGSNSLHLPPAANGYKWKQVFGDEFNTKTLQTNKWVTCYDWYSAIYSGCTNTGNHELEWYEPEQVKLTNGSAVLNAITKPTTGWEGSYEQEYPYQSGIISTGRSDWNSNPKSSYTYGFFEARIKTTSGKGVWPAFWLLPADKNWPPEIDIMEILGDKPNNVLMTYHWGANVSSHQKDSTIFTKLQNPNGWHTYAVNWQPGYIDWYIDGHKQKSVISNNVPSKAMEVIVSLAIGGDLPGNPDPTTPFPAYLQVDYIHIYQQVKS